MNIHDKVQFKLYWGIYPEICKGEIIAINESTDGDYPIYTIRTADDSLYYRNATDCTRADMFAALTTEENDTLWIKLDHAQEQLHKLSGLILAHCDQKLWDMVMGISYEIGEISHELTNARFAEMVN